MAAHGRPFSATAFGKMAAIQIHLGYHRILMAIVTSCNLFTHELHARPPSKVLVGHTECEAKYTNSPVPVDGDIHHRLTGT